MSIGRRWLDDKRRLTRHGNGIRTPADGGRGNIFGYLYPSKSALNQYEGTSEFRVPHTSKVLKFRCIVVWFTHLGQRQLSLCFSPGSEVLSYSLNAGDELTSTRTRGFSSQSENDSFLGSNEPGNSQRPVLIVLLPCQIKSQLTADGSISSRLDFLDRRPFLGFLAGGFRFVFCDGGCFLELCDVSFLGSVTFGRQDRDSRSKRCQDRSLGVQ